jgi:hypothetical protein
MFIIMAMTAEVFPVGTIGRIVMVVTVLVVNRQQINACLVKFTTAFGTDWTVNFQGFRPVVAVGINLTAHLFYQSSRLFSRGEDNSSRTM